MIQLVGLAFDAVGIVVICIPLLRLSADEIAEQTAAYIGYNSPGITALAYSRIDTIVGSFLLLLGFVLQALPLIVCPNSLMQAVAVSFLGLLVVGLVVYYLYLRPRHVSAIRKAAIDHLKE